MNKEQRDFVKPILDTFENEDIKKFAITLLDNLPPYIWEVGASSTGKYHPTYTLGYYGLMKHQVAVVRFINFFFELEQYNTIFNSRQRDCLRVAALIHDGRKSGSQKDYENSKYTKFNHPLLMAKEVMSYKDMNIIPNDDILYIAKAISSHMGQWNTDKKSDLSLPKPTSESQKLLHLADYLASRKSLNVDFSEYMIPTEPMEK